ncbi:MAG TPA: DMT family transporter [Solirubrobacteraceae bacterium]|jgi:drug/metabolite transporter (DMT)-like permease|nr:DMT family transporter [Solirubrobacteraceae bacterium]
MLAVIHHQDVFAALIHVFSPRRLLHDVSPGRLLHDLGPGLLNKLRAHIRAFEQRVYVPALVVIECLIGAVCYALSSVVQQQVASEQPDGAALRANLLAALMQSRAWWGGILLDMGGFVMQFLALRHGSLALVAPLFVVGLVFAIPGGAMVAHRQVTRMEWTATLLVVAGLAVFLAVAQPGPGHPRASTAGWLWLCAGTLAALSIALTLARLIPRRRALFLGVAAGTAFGVATAMMERTAHVVDHRGFAHALITWTPYALIALALLGLQLNQAAYQAGELKWSLPAITVVEPVVAIVIGQALFGEHIAAGALARTAEIAGLLLLTAGVLELARSPAIPQGTPAPSPH